MDEGHVGQEKHISEQSIMSLEENIYSDGKTCQSGKKLHFWTKQHVSREDITMVSKTTCPSK